jgi:hypothetical protein
MPDKAQIGRLAFRHEGEFWNAYWAPQMDSMSGAILLASIRMNLVENSNVMKDSFMTMSKAAFSVIIKDLVGVVPQWRDPQPAPERERPGEYITAGGKRGN